MSNIITTSELQRSIGKISQSIGEEIYIVTSHGKGKIILLPYFDGCDETITEYIEDYEMDQNKVKLQKRYQESSKSGESSLRF